MNRDLPERPDREARTAALAALPLFSRVPPEDLAPIAARTRVVDVAKGQVIVAAGASPGVFYGVLRGRVRLTVSSLPAGEKVVSLVSPGETFGEALLFTGRPYPVTALALTAGRLLAVPCAPVRELSDQRPGFGSAMAAGLAMRLHRLVSDVEQYALHSGTERVLAFLHDLAGHPTDGSPADPGLASNAPPALPPYPLSVRLPASKSVIASRLSLKPETLSRILRRLTEVGAIRGAGATITLVDPARARTAGLL
ncbi:Crp/Fnr family transcriptional regulator (plasmid) [Streptomyces sp. BI20]|uniref:Crp/Fnr family transcriptional regulator n=1 Tax=Streptomyces sp. BI20 TaxID=3403460 RepID=UPI003C74FE5D